MGKTKGFAAQSASAPLAAWEFDRREIGARDVSVDISYAGICHSDIHQVREEWGPAKFPMVPGHEIMGTVAAVGKDVTEFKVGDPVGVGVYVDSCRKCENCQSGESHQCLEGMTQTYNDFARDGKTLNFGGYSKNIVVDADYVMRVPANLDPKGVAPLLCAGITVYSPLRHWGAGPGKNVAVMGLGGLGHMAVKFAAAMGANVTVLSHSDSKKADALALSAHAFVNTHDEPALGALTKTQDIIINTVSADVDIDRFLKLLKLNGTLVIVGLPGKPAPINAGSLLEMRRSLAGSMIGSIKETQEMLDFCGKHNIVSDVEVIDADYINEAYDRVVNSDVRYRFVIDTATI